MREALHDDAQDIESTAEAVDRAIREGKFGRSLALVTAGAALVSGLEVAYEHFKGSYSRRVMYTPLACSLLLSIAATAATTGRAGTKAVLRATAAMTLADALLGFYFHVRGVARKPGGWSLPLTNVTMGPPLFAPLLFGTAGYLGLIASYLRDENETDGRRRMPRSRFERDVREGRFQRHLLLVTAIGSMFSGAEAWYSHEKSAFRIRSQWWPVICAPALSLACVAGIADRRLARALVPAVSLGAIVVSSCGVFFHVRGIVRRPGGLKTIVYNVLYGPPLFAPMLFGASGGMGLLATFLRRSR